jgi:hypothetical protein
MTEEQESAMKVAIVMSKIYTLLDLEDLNPIEAQGALISCIAEIIFTAGDLDKHEENLELCIRALRCMYASYKRTYLDGD